MSRLRVVFLSYYPTTFFGEHVQLRHRVVEHPASWVVTLTRAFEKETEVELHVVSESPNVTRNANVGVNGVHYHFLKSPATLNLSTLYALSVRRLVSVVRQLAPDIVHAHGTEGSIGLAGLYAGFPCLLTLQGIQTEIERADRQWFGASGLRVKMLAAIERYVIRRAKYVGTRTRFANGFVETLNASARVFHVPEAIGEDFFRIQPALVSKRIVFVGSMIARKGMAILINAMAQVRRSHPDSRLVLIGAGPDSYVADLQRLANSAGVQDSVEFSGFLTPGAVAREFENASVFVLPSFIENSPNALAEAMCAGLPVVATRVGGITSMVDDGVTGLLVSPGQEGELANAIARLLDDPGLRRRLGAAASKSARKIHSPSIVADQTIKIYREILKLEHKGTE